MSWCVELLVLLLLTRGNVQDRQQRQLHVGRADLAVGLHRESAMCLIWSPEDQLLHKDQQLEDYSTA